MWFCCWMFRSLCGGMSVKQTKDFEMAVIKKNVKSGQKFNLIKYLFLYMPNKILEL